MGIIVSDKICSYELPIIFYIGIFILNLFFNELYEQLSYFFIY